MRVRTLVLPLILLFFTVLHTQSQQKARILTLNECLTLAAQNNFEIRRLQAQLSAAGAQLTAAFGRYLPRISASAGYSRRLDEQQQQYVNVGGQLIPVPSSPPNSYSMGIGASLPIFDGFAREAQFAQTRQQIAQLQSSLEDRERQVRLQVHQQFLEILKAQRLLELRKADLEVAEKQLESLQAQFTAGRISKTEVYQQQAEVAAKRLAVVQAENQLNTVKMQLLSTIGLPPTSPVEISPIGIPDSITAEMRAELAPFSENPEQAIAVALENRPDYIAAQKQIEIAKLSQSIARSGYFPSLSASLSWSWANSELRDFSRLGRTYFGLSLQIPLFDNFQTNEQIQSAYVQLQQRQIELEQLEYAITTEVQQAIHQLRSAERELDAAATALEAAKVSAASTRERYAVGRSTLLEQILADSQYLTAQLNYYTALFNYLTARYQFLSSIGRL